MVLYLIKKLGKPNVLHELFVVIVPSCSNVYSKRKKQKEKLEQPLTRRGV